MNEKRHKDILKDFGEAIYPASYILNNPPSIISVGPKIDIALGGGVPEGCLFILTGPEKVGKTITALQFAANAQKVKISAKSNNKRNNTYDITFIMEN